MKNSNYQSMLACVLRIILGSVFVFSGFVKAIDPLGTVYKIEDYLTAFGGFFNLFMPMAGVIAGVLIAVEFALGVMLLLNVFTKWVKWLTLVFYICMTILTLYIAIENPVSDCGCFGDAIVISNWETFWKNVILLVCATLLVSCKRYRQQFFVWPIELAILCISILSIGGFMVHSLQHLPIIDFRPYKIGNNLLELMEYPEDAEPDVYDVTLVYAKDGVEYEFTQDNYPRNDSTWVFVSQNSKLVKQGYVPPIHDFEIINSDYEEITYDILESETPVTLAIMYDLGKTDLEQAKRLNELYAACVERGELFYAVTGSGEDEIISYELQTNAEYPICTCDPVTLKTIVRANPGIVVVQQGVVIDKYNLRNR